MYFNKHYLSDNYEPVFDKAFGGVRDKNWNGESKDVKIVTDTD